ncbi:uncharacterized protein TNCV_1594191 [Trichonephila clavipes]|nr:uncharacterized protein TNCV_1594191 [Trichonephila clavipes]
MATGSYMTPIYSRSQSEVQGDLHIIANDIEEYHALTKSLEGNKEFVFFSLKPKPVKPIKIVIKGLPIFTKTHGIQSDLEEE